MQTSETWRHRHSSSRRSFVVCSARRSGLRVRWRLPQPLHFPHQHCTDPFGKREGPTQAKRVPPPPLRSQHGVTASPSPPLAPRRAALISQRPLVCSLRSPRQVQPLCVILMQAHARRRRCWEREAKAAGGSGNSAVRVRDTTDTHTLAHEHQHINANPNLLNTRWNGESTREKKGQHRHGVHPRCAHRTRTSLQANIAHSTTGTASASVAHRHPPPAHAHTAPFPHISSTRRSGGGAGRGGERSGKG